MVRRENEDDVGFILGAADFPLRGIAAVGSGRRVPEVGGSLFEAEFEARIAEGIGVGGIGQQGDPVMGKADVQPGRAQHRVVPAEFEPPRSVKPPVGDHFLHRRDARDEVTQERFCGLHFLDTEEEEMLVVLIEAGNYVALDIVAGGSVVDGFRGRARNVLGDERGQDGDADILQGKFGDELELGREVLSDETFEAFGGIEVDLLDQFSLVQRNVFFDSHGFLYGRTPAWPVIETVMCSAIWPPNSMGCPPILMSPTTNPRATGTAYSSLSVRPGTPRTIFQ